MAKSRKFDVALSFAGEDRALVEQIAVLLRSHEIKVFYDEFEQAVLWGKNLYDYLTKIYSEDSRFTVIFVSKHYKKKLWTNLERQAMQSRAFKEKGEYILPIRLDSTKIPGLLDTTGYLNGAGISAESLASMIIKKLSQE